MPLFYAELHALLRDSQIGKMILLIDNYDSFVFNLARYVERLGHEALVVRNDSTSAEEAIQLSPQAIILSPGPCLPADAGVSVELVFESAGRVPLLGVCLGHQAIAAAFGANVVRSERPMHGRASPIHHDGLCEFVGLPDPFIAARYHSLRVDEASLPVELTVSARSESGDVMALRHRDHPIVGWQFHPESILTEQGVELLASFLRFAGIGSRGNVDRVDASHVVTSNQTTSSEPTNIAAETIVSSERATTVSSRSDEP